MHLKCGLCGSRLLKTMYHRYHGEVEAISKVCECGWESLRTRVPSEGEK